MTPTPERLVPVGDIELCVAEHGDPKDPTVLLVHGAAASYDWWDDELCERIAAGGRHVVRYDHRDTGRSTTGTPGSPSYDAGQLQRDCVGLVRALAGGQVHLVGLSMGGGIGQVIALEHPELLASLTLIATTPVGGVDDELPPPIVGTPPPQPDLTSEDQYADWMVEVQRLYCGPAHFDPDRTHATARQAHRRSHDVRAADNHWLAPTPDTDVDHDVRRITTPTLVVHGSADPLFPLPHGGALARAIPRAHLLVLDGAGHETPPPGTYDLFVPTLLAHTRSDR